MSAHINWTAGLELDAKRRLGDFEIAAVGELGQSFYAALDSGAPTAGFGARASLAISYAGAATASTRTRNE